MLFLERPCCDRRHTTLGFTLVEILIVVVILGILAAIVVPQMSNATDTALESSTQMTVRRIRNQLEVYKAEHSGTPPALATFAAQMTMATNALGATAAPGTAGYNFGPYIERMPVNPYTGTSTVSNGAVGSSAWYYDQTTGAFHANNSAELRAY